MIKYGIMSLLLLTLPLVSHSAEIWSGRTKIVHLYPTSYNYIFMVNFSNALSTCDSGKRYSIAQTNSNYNALVSTLTAAFMAGKEISFNVNDDQGNNCAPIINRFIVY